MFLPQMREVLDAISGTIDIAGYDISVIALAIGGLFIAAALFRNTWPAMVGGLLLFVFYFLLPAVNF